MSIYTTYTKQLVDISVIQPENISLEDIAHSLAFQCRFNGHTKRFYSVAEHSMILAHLIENDRGVQNLNRRMAALLHDAAECYLGDITAPVQKHLFVSPDVETVFLQRIFSACSIPYSCLDDELRNADADLTILEGYNLIGGLYWTKRRHILYNRNPEFVRTGELLINSHSGTTWESPNIMATHFLNKLEVGLMETITGETLTGESDAEPTN